MNTFSSTSFRPQALLWLLASVGIALVLGVMVAFNVRAVLLPVLGAVWLLTVARHGYLSATIILATFNSAFVLAFLPGALPVSDLACCLAWTGVPLLVFLGRYPKNTMSLVRQYWMVFAGIGLYVITLFMLMRVRGLDFGFQGGTTGGAKIYLQQIIFAIVPLLFIIVPMPQKTFIVLLALHFVLSITYVISELALAYAPRVADYLFYFMQPTQDAFTFEAAFDSGGFRRLQSLFYFCPKLIFALLIFYSVRDVMGRRSWWLVPAILALLIGGLESGHRANIIYTGAVLITIFVVQREFSPRNALIVGACLIVGIAMLYLSVRALPFAVQRAVSFLPGLDVPTLVAADAEGTWNARTQIAKRGIELIPHYLWLGRGFTRFPVIYAGSLESISSVEFSVLQGYYLNGFIGLMVNTGLLGTFAICLFLAGGFKLALKVVKISRKLGFDQLISRASAVVASLFIVDVFFFFFIEGNADWALRRYGVYVGILFACLRYLNRALESGGVVAPGVSHAAIPTGRFI